MRISYQSQSLFLAFLTATIAQQCPPGYTFSPTIIDTNSTTSGTPSDTSSTSVEIITLGTSTILRTISSTITSTVTSAFPLNTGSINWTPCPAPNATTLQCGTIIVPVDWTTAGRKRQEQVINLQLRRVPAQNGNSSARSIIINPGGPGASGIVDILEGYVAYQEMAGDNFNLVSFDPRGVGFTEPYQCMEIANIPGNGDYYSTVGLEATYNYSVAQSQECAKPQYGSDLIGTAFAARDINAIAQALGEDGLIRYWGFSYGTLLGATLAAMFPDKIERMILDGNINPTDYYHGLGDESLADVDAALANFFDQCAAAGTAKCALAEQNALGRELLATFNGFLEELQSGNATAKDIHGNDVDFSKVKSDLFDALKDPSSWIKMSVAIRGYYNTKQTTTRAAGLVKRDAPDSKGLTLSAIRCGDHDPMQNVTAADFQRFFDIDNARSKFGGDQWVSHIFTCSTWQVLAKERFAGKFEGIQTRHPLLFVQTPFDPVCPLVSARNSSFGFPGSKVQLHNAAGHCSTASRSTALDAIINTYWNTGALPSGDSPTVPNKQNNFDPDPPAAKRKRATAAGVRFEPRQDVIPSGCVPISNVSTTSTSVSLPVSNNTTITSTSVPAQSLTNSTSTSTAFGVNVSDVISSTFTISTSTSSSSSIIASQTSMSAARTVTKTMTVSITISTCSLISACLGSVDATTTGSSSSYDTSVHAVLTSTTSSTTTTISDANPSSSVVSTTSTVSFTSTESTVVRSSISDNLSVHPTLQSTSSLVWSFDVASPCLWTAVLAAGTSIPGMPYGLLPNSPVLSPDPRPTGTSRFWTNGLASQNSPYPTAQNGTDWQQWSSRTTVYVIWVPNVCPTGLTQSPITVTATCNSKCTARPTGIPPGYTTTQVFCSACQTPSSVVVTTAISGKEGTSYQEGTTKSSTPGSASSAVGNIVASQGSAYPNDNNANQGGEYSGSNGATISRNSNVSGSVGGTNVQATNSVNGNSNNVVNGVNNGGQGSSWATVPSSSTVKPYKGNAPRLGNAFEIVSSIAIILLLRIAI